MSQLINNLRLQTAQFNNFLIENYLEVVSNKEGYGEPYIYLFDSFFRLSEGLSSVGSAFGNIDEIQIQNLISLKECIAEAAVVVYLIEESTDIDRLSLNIKSINTYYLKNNIDNITAYGKKFNKPQSKINTEIDDLKEDNPGYFDSNGTYTYNDYQISLDEAVNYLSNNATVLQVRNAFKKVNEIYQYFSSIISDTDNTVGNYTGEKVFLGELLNTVAILLIALGYIEPFFRKPNDIVRLFEQHIEEISVIQAAIFSSLQ